MPWINWLWRSGWFLVILMGLLGAVQAEVTNRIVAVVNNEVITWLDLEVGLKRQLPPGVDSRDPEVQKQMLFQLIDQKLLESQVKKQGLQVSKEEVDGALKKIREDQGLSRNEDFAAALAGQGLSETELRQRIQDQILRFRLVNREIGSKIFISEQRLREYYQNNPNLFSGREQIHLAQILILNSEKLPPEAAKARAEEIANRLEKGEDFNQLAKTLSDDPSGGQGGDLGSFDAGELDPALREVVSALKPGQTGRVQSVPEGWRIVKLIDRKKTETLTWEQARERIQERLYQEEMEARFKQWIQRLRERSSIQILL